MAHFLPGGKRFVTASAEVAVWEIGRALLACRKVLAERDRLNDEIQSIVDEATEPWGVKVTRVEIRDVNLPSEIQRAMARQAEAERDRRAKIINAEGEFQAAEKLAEAAEVIARHPVAYQLRMLQTMTEVAAEKNSTLVFPVPVELLAAFQRISEVPALSE